ncbi:MAG: pyridoxal phosphate-dependent aminotransferase [Eubacteriales bacterium]|nr:pyridoxal phosphate-dependent aminotransferase [Eubacteriales bacterium]
MLNQQVVQAMQGGSAIRKMFEEGNRRRKLYGAENVYDFSLGNPDLEPPRKVQQAFAKFIQEPNIHKYMPNAGFDDVRQAVADYEARRWGKALTAAQVVMTVGAAGGLNVALKALLNPGDEVIILSPYFVEYKSYIGNSGGVPVEVRTADDFQPDAAAIAAALTPRTKAIILNTPHNPTGVIYTAQKLAEVADVLRDAEKKYGAGIYVISDEPYAKLCYQGEVPSLFRFFDNAIIGNSFSKSLCLPGERIGYLAVNPEADESELLCGALAYTNRTLGFVNAPSLLQKVVGATLDEAVDVEIYRERRDMLYHCITSLGMECILPDGAFYLFPKVPGGDSAAFVDAAANENILIVNGAGFGAPGYVRIAYCVDTDMIRRSLPAWQRLLSGYNK